MRFAVLVLLFLLPSLGCVTQLPRDQPFSKAWSQHQQHEWELTAREKRMDNGEWVLAGRKDATRAAIQMDDEGKPTLNIGRQKGLSADVDADLDKASVFFKYKWRWKVRPKEDRGS